MNFQKEVPESVKKILTENNVEYIDIEYFAYPQTFGSTAGPSGVFGGNSMSTFTIEAFVCDSVGPTVFLCAGMYAFKDERFKPFENIKKWKKLNT